MAQSFNTNLTNVIKHYIQMLKVPVTITKKEKLTQNPITQALVSNVFNKLVSKRGNELTRRKKIEPPFIAYCSGQNTGSDFVLVTKITDTSVSYISESSKAKHLTKEDFLKQWQKTVFVAEAYAESGEYDFMVKKRAENLKSAKQNLLYAGVVLFIGLMTFSLISRCCK